MLINMKVKLLLMWLCLGFYESSPQKLGVYHQVDYNVKLERAEQMYCNPVMARHCKIDFVLYNRTQRVLNASWEQLQDFTNDFTMSVQMYKFLSNEYRFFPLTMKGNFCYEYSQDRFGFKTIVEKNSNFRGCPLKRGTYCLYNILPDFSKFPPYIPKGAYKLEVKFYHKNEEMAQNDLYVSILEKPMNW